MHNNLLVPRVSIVMAAYNYGHYIGTAIQSVLNQDMPDWELIIVDDGSTDNTRNVVNEYSSDPRIRYLYHDNQGQPATENLGISFARAAWIAFIDADDCWLPSKLTKQLELASKNPDAAVIYAERALMNASGSEIPAPRRIQYRGEILDKLFRQNFIPFSSAMAKADVLQKAGGFNPEYRHANDYDLWLRIAVLGYKFDFVPEILIRYRTGHANLTSRSDVQLQTALLIMDRFVDIYPDLLPPNWVRLCYSETYCHLAMFYSKKGKKMDSLQYFMRALKTYPANGEAWRAICASMIPTKFLALAKKRFGPRS